MVQDYPHSIPNTYMQYYLYPNTMVKRTDIIIHVLIQLLMEEKNE